MIASRLAALLLAGLCSAGFAQESGPPKPRRPPRPDPSKKRPPPELLVKLPDDFVQYVRIPEGGVRPRVGVGKTGLALLYTQGDGALGDLYLALSKDEAKTFSPGVRVNPAPGTVLSWGKTQSGSVDVGPDGGVHVAWVSGGEKPAVQYVRATAEGELAEVRELGSPAGLGSTTAVTVDDRGQIFVVYSADGPELDLDGNPMARIWLRRSLDGTNFTEPVAIDPTKNVSIHSNIAAHVDEVMGTVYVLYRSAHRMYEDNPVVSRSMRLLSSKDRGESFEVSPVDNLRGVRDPQTSGHLSQEKNSTLAAWDGDGRVCWSIIRRQLQQTQLPVEPKSLGPDVVCTHASCAAGGNEIILTWLQRPENDRNAPPRLGWQVWLREGRRALGEGQAPEPALGGGQVVFPRRAGGFTIVY
jgi:hypothetical protein